MSRSADALVVLPAGVEVSIQPDGVAVKGSKGTLDMKTHRLVQIEQQDGRLQVSARQPNNKEAMMHAGTVRALITNMVQGVSVGFKKKLLLVGVGYRVQAKGKTLSLLLGFSHPVIYKLPDGIDGQVPSQTEIIVLGMDRQKVGQVAADLRALRPAEPYEGKGIRYADERIKLKEAKKK